MRPDSNVQGVALTITSTIDEHNKAIVRVIGAGALNQAMKGVILARQQLAARGLDLVVRPGFNTVKGGTGDNVSAIVLNCFAN